MNTRRGFLASIAAAVMGVPLVRRISASIRPPVPNPELTLSMEEFSRQFIEPSLARWADGIDAQILKSYNGYGLDSNGWAKNTLEHGDVVTFAGSLNVAPIQIS
jgi:hypothetical protein